MNRERHSHDCIFYCFLVLLLLLGGCAGTNVPSAKRPVQTGMVEDLYHFPQNLQAYVDSRTGSQRLLASEEQESMNARFDRLYFGPWHTERVSVKPNDAFAIFGGRKGASRPRGWAENLLPWTQEAWDRLVENASRETFPSRLDCGITVEATVLREAPTMSPRFGNPDKAGQGFPFDLFMYSSLPAGMPVLVIHTSADGAWVYVETALVSGWVPARDVALADAAFRDAFETGRYGVLVQDGISLRDAGGRTVCTGNLGTLLPLVSMGKKGATLLAPVRDMQGNAVLCSVTVPADVVVRKPLPLTADALAKIGNGTMGQVYGWGGAFGVRDCSLLLRDLFVPFGIWLPRNSAAQARSWAFQDFSKLSPAEKEAMILERGKPFATLLWLPGHIALYVGEVEGKAAMFHTLWGIRTREGRNEGRYIVGRTVVTSLAPGRELPQAADRTGLISRMKGMSILH